LRRLRRGDPHPADLAPIFESLRRAAGRCRLNQVDP
jgi:hypothetical protein